jgi:predicted O-methyltransferase YrrM
MWFHFFSYIHYRFKRKRFVHSAFVYDFIISALKQKEIAPEWIEIEKRYQQLRKNKQELHIIDRNVNSNCHTVSLQKTAQITKQTCKSAKVRHLLFHLVKQYHCHTIVEFGDCIGINTAYIGKANPQAYIFTVVISPETAKIASDIFEQLDLTTIELVNMDFDAAIVLFADKFKDIDMFFIDGNHTSDSILRYFYFAKNYAKDNTLFIFSHIHCSPKMEQVWKKIQADTQVSITIDLYAIGIVFFRKGIVKQDFIL